MDTLEKIKRINKKCNNSLSITCYDNYWSIHSYKEGTLLRKWISGNTLEDVLNKAMKAVEENEGSNN